MDRHPDRAAALASLRERWGAAAPRPATEVFGALAVAPHPAASPRLATNTPALLPLPDIRTSIPTPVPPRSRPASDATDRTIPTGFPALDALLAAGGLPRAGTVVLAGAGSSGATTLALRVLAEAQAGGALAAWVDLPRALDPVEAVARGVRLEWLAVLVPDGPAEALAMAGTLLQARAVDILVLDLGTARTGAPASRSPAPTTSAPITPATPMHPARHGPRPPSLADQLARLVAFARRAGALLLVLEPAGTPAPLRAALDEGAGLRLELRRSGWVRLGREVVGQRTEVRVAKDHHGVPDRRTTLRILYAEGGPRDRCLARDELLVEEPVAGAPPGILRPGAATFPGPTPAVPPRPQHEPHPSTDAPPPSLLATSRAPARPAAAAREPARRAADPRRAAVG